MVKIKSEYYKNRYKALFSFSSTYSIFRYDDSEGKSSIISKNYKCVSLESHDCVVAEEVLVDIMFKLRSGEVIDLLAEDIICICINGVLFVYRYLGMNSWSVDELSRNYYFLGTDFFAKEKQQVAEEFHKNGMVLDVLSGTGVEFVGDEAIKKYHFYGVERESYNLQPLNTISEYNLYSLKGNKIVRVNPGGISFYDFHNVLLFFLKKCKGKKHSVLLYNRKELECIKDILDIKMGAAYGTM